ncbi:unnamed protein product [Lampetra planeri]
MAPHARCRTPETARIGQSCELPLQRSPGASRERGSLPAREPPAKGSDSVASTRHSPVTARNSRNVECVRWDAQGSRADTLITRRRPLVCSAGLFECSAGWIGSGKQKASATFLGKEKPDAEERDARFRGTRHSARADCLVPLAADFTECRALPGRVVPLR